jgi:hypothetical protein
MEFCSEKCLTETVLQNSFFEDLVDSDLFPTKTIFEPKGLFGIPDIVVINFEIYPDNKKVARSFAFELKIRKWQRALIQAYKYLAFSNFSYVILDHSYINPAIKNIDLFRKANVGLISVDFSGIFYSHYTPSYSEPYNTDLENKFKNIVTQNISIRETSIN